MGMRVVVIYTVALYIIIFVYAHGGRMFVEKKKIFFFANVMVDSAKCFVVIIEDVLTGCFVKFFIRLNFAFY